MANKAPCIKCNERVKKGVECSICKLWIHVKCSDLDDGEFKLIETMAKKEVFISGHVKAVLKPTAICR